MSLILRERFIKYTCIIGDGNGGSPFKECDPRETASYVDKFIQESHCFAEERIDPRGRSHNFETDPRWSRLLWCSYARVKTEHPAFFGRAEQKEELAPVVSLLLVCFNQDKFHLQYLDQNGANFGTNSIRMFEWPRIKY